MCAFRDYLDQDHAKRLEILMYKIYSLHWLSKYLCPAEIKIRLLNKFQAKFTAIHFNFTPIKQAHRLKWKPIWLFGDLATSVSL